MSIERRGLPNLLLLVGAATAGALSTASSCNVHGDDRFDASCEERGGLYDSVRNTCVFPDAASADSGSNVPDAGWDGGFVETPCTIAASRWSSTAERGIVRSLAIRGAVFAISEGAPDARLEKLTMADGQPAGSAAVQQPGAAGQFFARLQVVPSAASANLYLSFLGPQQGDTSLGGLARVGSVESTLPTNISLTGDFTPAVDGIFASSGDPIVLSYPTPSTTTATLSTLAPDGGVAPLATLAAGTNGTTRTFGVRADGRLVGLIRKDHLQGTWKGWLLTDVSTTVQPIVLPGTIVDATAHDSQPILYGLTESGLVTEYVATTSSAYKTRDIVQLPPSVVPAKESFARMAYAEGSLFFPGTIDGAPHLVRVRVDSGAVSGWPAVRGDHAGWSALAAGDGIVCYGDDANAVHCGCAATAFIAKD